MKAFFLRRSKKRRHLGFSRINTRNINLREVFLIFIVRGDVAIDRKLLSYSYAILLDNWVIKHLSQLIKFSDVVHARLPHLLLLCKLDLAINPIVMVLTMRIMIA